MYLSKDLVLKIIHYLEALNEISGKQFEYLDVIEDEKKRTNLFIDLTRSIRDVNLIIYKLEEGINE